MDMKRKIKKYEKIIIAALESEFVENQTSEVRNILISDKQKHHYVLLKTGWYNPKSFTDNMLIHFEIREDAKVWLLANHTESLITEELVRRGIPPTDIVLGFYTPIIRAASGYAMT